jgi:hypothetical protein
MLVRSFSTTSRPACGRPPPAAVLGRQPPRLNELRSLTGWRNRRQAKLASAQPYPIPSDQLQLPRVEGADTMEAWWHDFYSTTAQVTAILLLAAVVEEPIRSSIIGRERWKSDRRWFFRFMAKDSVKSLRIKTFITVLWTCATSVAFALWILGEKNPHALLISIGQWLIGLPTVILALLIAIGVILHLGDEMERQQNNTNRRQSGTSIPHHNNNET